MAAITKNTAGQGLPVFAQDISAQEGKTGYGPNIVVYVSLDGASAAESDATSTGTGNVTEIGGGYYWCPLTQAETDADVIVVFCDRTGTADVAFDRLVVGTDSGSTDTAAIADAVLDETLSGHTSVGSLGERIGRIPNYAAGGASGLPTVDANNYVAGIVGDYANTFDDIAGTGFITTTHALDKTATLTQVNTEVDQALSDIGLHKLTSEALGTGTVADSSIVSRIVSKSATPSWSSYDNTTDSLEAIRDRGDSAWTGSGTGGGDATAANQTTIIGHLTDIKGGGFSGSTDSLEAIRDNGDLAWTTYVGPSGTGWPTPATIWAHSPRTLTQTGAQLASVVAGTLITIQRGDTLSASLTSLGSVATYSKIWFTVKKTGGSQADSDSMIQITLESGTGASDGLIRINAGEPTNSSNGSITVDDAADGDITITLAAVESAKLVAGSYSYDVQVLYASGTVTTLVSGGCTISADLTKATS